MNKPYVWLIGLLPLLSALSACNRTESNSKVVINEVLAHNANNFQDDYGARPAWIELFNKSYGSVDIAGYTLRTSCRAGDTVAYHIPKGDVQTLIKPRQHLLFWADGQPGRGTFHTNCTLDTLRANWIGLFDAGGRLLDAVSVPVTGSDLSYARIKDADPTWEVKGTSDNHYVTPSTNNRTIEQNEKVEKFHLHDQSGVGMSLTAMLVVFTGLVLLYILFRSLGHEAVILRQAAKDKFKREHSEHMEMKTEEQENKATCGCGNEVYAAIAMALFESIGEVHDKERQVLTIHRTSSPWNGKWNTLRVIPQKK